MDLSIVSTIYCTGSYLKEFCTRAFHSAEKAGYHSNSIEILLVNDGCPNNGLHDALDIFAKEPRIKIIDLSRNFGHHKAMMIGCSQAQGQEIFLIDSDLEESPEWIIEFKKKKDQDNADVVYGVQKKRKGALFESLSGGLFYTIFNFLSSEHVEPNMITARLMSRRFVDKLSEFQDREPFFFGLCISVGYKQEPYFITKTSSSPSSYTFRKKIKLALDSITSYSAKPLIFIAELGVIITFLSILMIIYIIIKQVIYGYAPIGWSSLMLSVWFMGGIILFCLGVIGIYISRIYTEIKHRPYTVIRKIYSHEDC